MRFRTSFLLLAMVVACSFSMTSCIKNYTCRCTIKYSGYPGLPDSVVNEYTISNSKAEAKNKCDKESGNYNNNISSVETCVLY